MNKIAYLYHLLFESRNTGDLFSAYAFGSKMEAMGIAGWEPDKISIFESDTSLFEKNVLDLIIKTNGIEIVPDYVSAYMRDLNCHSETHDGEEAIIIDELWIFTGISFCATLFSFANDNRTDNFIRCFKNFFVLLDLQGKKKTIGVHNNADIDNMMLMPANILNLAMDCYWCAWTFLIGHELYHLHNSNVYSGVQEEIEADTYGYRILLNMINKQKEGLLGEEIDCFNESCYLSPIIMLKYFELLERYLSACGEEIHYNNYPTPEQRQEHIFLLADELLPISFDTDEGDELLNIILDSIDLLWEQLIIKKKLGKLDIDGNTGREN